MLKVSFHIWVNSFQQFSWSIDEDEHMYQKFEKKIQKERIGDSINFSLLSFFHISEKPPFQQILSECPNIIFLYPFCIDLDTFPFSIPKVQYKIFHSLLLPRTFILWIMDWLNQFNLFLKYPLFNLPSLTINKIQMPLMKTVILFF